MSIYGDYEVLLQFRCGHFDWFRVHRETEEEFQNRMSQADCPACREPKWAKKTGETTKDGSITWLCLGKLGLDKLFGLS